MKLHCRYIIVFCCCFLGMQSVLAQDIAQTFKQKPLTISGSLSLGSSFYQVKNIPSRREPFSWYLSGSPVLTVYGITMPFSLVVSDQERKFSQPFNQYGVSPYYKWITVHAGYRNLRFSEFTMNGANFLGGGVELRPGKFRLAAIYGRFNRAVEEDSTMSSDAYGYIRPVYKRMGYAAKIGYGTASRYVDLLFFSAKDDTSSIAGVSTESQVNPEENIALGVKSQMGFLRNRLNFDLDAGASFLTRDIRRGNILDSANNPSLRYIAKYLAVNGSSGFFTGVTSSLSYLLGFGSIKGTYRRIDPGYRSLGAYYFQNDIEQFTINPSFNLWSNRLSFNLSYGTSKDNLDNKRYATTRRQVYSANVNIVANDKLNINLDYSNFGISQQRGVGDIFNDSTAMRVINGNIGGTVSYRPIQSEDRSHQLTFSTYYQNTNDLNRFTEQYSEANTLISSLSYNLSLPAKKLNATAALSYNKTDVIDRDIVSISPTITVSKLFLKDKLRASFTENLQLRTTNNEQDGFTSTTSLSLSYRIQRHTLSASSNYLKNKYKVSSLGSHVNDFSEVRSSLSYSINF